LKSDLLSKFAMFFLALVWFLLHIFLRHWCSPSTIQPLPSPRFFFLGERFTPTTHSVSRCVQSFLFVYVWVRPPRLGPLLWAPGNGLFSPYFTQIPTPGGVADPVDFPFLWGGISGGWICQPLLMATLPPERCLVWFLSSGFHLSLVLGCLFFSRACPVLLDLRSSLCFYPPRAFFTGLFGVSFSLVKEYVSFCLLQLCSWGFCSYFFIFFLVFRFPST